MGGELGYQENGRRDFVPYVMACALSRLYKGRDSKRGVGYSFVIRTLPGMNKTRKKPETD